MITNKKRRELRNKQRKERRKMLLKFSKRLFQKPTYAGKIYRLILNRNDQHTNTEKSL